MPNDAELEMDAFLPNKDTGFVWVGQELVIKAEAFPSPMLSRWKANLPNSSKASFRSAMCNACKTLCFR